MRPTEARRSSRERHHRQRGAAVVEFALVASFLLVIALGTVDFGRVFYTAMALTNAARAGAIYGAQSAAKSSDFAGMDSAAVRSAASDIGAITATASRSCECEVGGTTTVMANCNVACAGTLRNRVTVTASKAFTMLVNFPFLQRTRTVSRTAIMRAQ